MAVPVSPFSRGTSRRAVVLALVTAAGRPVLPVAARKRRRTVRCAASAVPDENTFFDRTGAMAQTFVAPLSGRLASVSVTVSKLPGSTGDHLVEVLAVDGAGVPDRDAVLAAQVFANDELGAGDHLLTATFGGGGPKVRKGRTYAVAVHRGGERYHLLGRMGEACAGQAYAQGGLPGAGFARQDGFEVAFAATVVAR